MRIQTSKLYELLFLSPKKSISRYICLSACAEFFFDCVCVDSYCMATCNAQSQLPEGSALSHAGTCVQHGGTVRRNDRTDSTIIANIIITCDYAFNFKVLPCTDRDLVPTKCTIRIVASESRLVCKLKSRFHLERV